MDLAILTLADSSAFAGIRPLELATEMPKLRSSVQVYGYPTGGAAISVTEGVVSRIEYVRYHHDASGLRFQIDAGIGHQHLVLETAIVKESMAEILEEYSIPRQGSKSLLKLWEAGKDDDK